MAIRMTKEKRIISALVFFCPALTMLSTWASEDRDTIRMVHREYTLNTQGFD